MSYDRAQTDFPQAFNAATMCSGIEQGTKVSSPYARPQLAPMVEAYIASVIRTCSDRDSNIVSVVLFGSSAVGGYSAGISDVDLLIVLRDGATREQRRGVCEAISEVEQRCGVAKAGSHHRSGLQAFADRVTANVRAFFVCTRSDLLSGDPARVLDIPRAQAVFVDRVAIPSIVSSGITVWGEDLLARVELLPIRRLDVAKAFFSLFNQVLFTVMVYPLLAGATKYAMDALKRSVHNCHFCYQLRPAPLRDEVAFFEQRHGPSSALSRLLSLRAEYQTSFRFVLACLPAIARLHLRTAADNKFPRHARAGCV